MREITEKANQIRDVINYIKVFKNALAVIHIDDEIIDSPLLPNHIHDISLIHEAGIKVIIVPGARRQINNALKEQKISWQIKNGFRITDTHAMPAIKTAAFDVANNIMNILAGEHLTAVIGNWVKARGKGIIDGTDFGSAGEIDKIKIDAIKQTLENGFVPIFPCIGWNDLGKPYNISSTELATQIAIHLKAEKLFFIFPDAQISKDEFSLPDGIAVSQEGNIPAMNIETLSKILELNSASEKNSRKEKLLSIFTLAKDACENGVSRIHILDGNSEGILPCEIFSAIGSGTMIFNNGYGDLRPMRDDDIPSVLSLMSPFIKSGILLPRNLQTLKSQLYNYIVYNVDGGIHACAALKKYDDGQMEIYSVAVDEAYSNMGVGPKMINFLLEKAKSGGAKTVFILTTQTADWFEKLGFAADKIDSLPAERRKIWSEKRGSKVFRISF